MGLNRAERRSILKEVKKRHSGKLTKEELFELYESNIALGKETHKSFVQKAESANSEIEGAAAYKIYEHMLEFFKDENKAMEEYRKVMEYRERRNNR